MAAGSAWGSNVPVSMPDPPENPPQLDMGGMGMTAYGMAHVISQSDIDDILQPYFGPDVDGRD
jgi:hypothetical protein